jgi:hypothetical protein
VPLNLYLLDYTRAGHIGQQHADESPSFEESQNPSKVFVVFFNWHVMLELDGLAK